VAGARRTEVQQREERLARVRREICETIAPHDLRLSKDQACLGEVRSLDLGVVRIVCAVGERIDGEVIRTPRLIRASDPELCKIDLQLRGRVVVGQDDRQVELAGGAFTFIDLSRPSHLVGELDGVAAVMFPRSLLPLRYADTKQLAGAAFHPQDAGTSLVAALVGQLSSRSNEYAPDAAARIGAAVFDLILAALSARLDRSEAVPPGTRMRVLRWRVKAYIEERLGDPRLSPAEIAAAHHVSLRYLYRIFEAERSTVGSWIRGRRLRRCREDLADPALRDRPVSAVGARWGFIDPTHFGRVFKAEFGVTPSDYRRMYTDGRGSGTGGRDVVAHSPPT
jgi:AraC-like DNA-binding protein